ncbi:hypothetical protein HDV64DRAFT_242466 [Trichoderma sp. TUCIM 5745]
MHMRDMQTINFTMHNTDRWPTKHIGSTGHSVISILSVHLLRRALYLSMGMASYGIVAEQGRRWILAGNSTPAAAASQRCYSTPGNGGIQVTRPSETSTFGQGTAKRGIPAPRLEIKSRLTL